jgi:hypothetical protein
MEKSPTYKDAWVRGKRCVIPAASLDEPNWETGRNIWRFRSCGWRRGLQARRRARNLAGEHPFDASDAEFEST